MSTPKPPILAFLPSPHFHTFPPHEYIEFASECFERNSALDFGLVLNVHGNGVGEVGKYGKGLGNACNYCNGAGKEESSGKYQKLYILKEAAEAAGGNDCKTLNSSASSPPPRTWWARVSTSDIASRAIPEKAARVFGIAGGYDSNNNNSGAPTAALVRIVLDDGSSAHPGFWRRGEYPYIAWGGGRRSVDATTPSSKAFVEVLCASYGGGGGGSNDSAEKSLRFRPREIAAAFGVEYELGDTPFNNYAKLKAWGEAEEKRRRDAPRSERGTQQSSFPVRSALTIPFQPRGNFSRTFTSADDTPKITVCHDFKGGYHDCDYTYSRLTAVEKARGDEGENGAAKSKHADPTAGCGGSNCTVADEQSTELNTVLQSAYTFQYWHIVDTFIYFAHEFISPPTSEWINICHKNGVRCLGTIITENQQGFLDCSEMLKTPASAHRTCELLTLLAQVRGFDGYLINIENPLGPNELTNLQYFIATLTEMIHVAFPNGQGHVQWYDSVTVRGTLEYQNAVTPANLPYMLACDGIFTNYWWTPAHVDASKRIIQLSSSSSSSSPDAPSNRLRDAYFGIDVHGRGTYGGGKLNTQVAAEVLVQKGVSIAIFGPGWSRESVNGPYSAFLGVDGNLWNRIAELVLLAKQKGTSPLSRPSPLLSSLLNISGAQEQQRQRLPVPSLTSLPFATSSSNGCGTLFAMPKTPLFSSTLSAPSLTRCPWSQQTAAEAPFAFVKRGPLEGSGAEPSYSMLWLKHSEADEEKLLSARVNADSGADSFAPVTAFKSVREGPVTLQSSATLVFQGTHSVSCAQEARSGISDEWLLLVHGNARLSEDPKSRTDVDDGSEVRAVGAVVVTAASAGESDPFEFILYVLSKNGALGVIAPTVANSQPLPLSSAAASAAASPRWASHHLTFVLTQDATAATGLAMRRRRGGDAASALNAANHSVFIGRVAIGAPRWISNPTANRLNNNANGHTEAEKEAIVSPTAPFSSLSVEILKSEQFSNGRGGLFFRVTGMEDALVKADGGESLYGFAAHVSLKLVSGETLAPLFAQQAFLGVHRTVPDSRSTVEEEEFVGGRNKKSRRPFYLMALPIDNIQLHDLADTKRGDFISVEVTLVPEFEALPTISMPTKEGGFLNTQRAVAVGARFNISVCFN